VTSAGRSALSKRGRPKVRKESGSRVVPSVDRSPCRARLIIQQSVWADGSGTVRAQDIPPSANLLISLVKLGNYPLDWMFAVKLGIEAPPPLVEIIGDIAPRPIMLIGGGRPLSKVGSEELLQSRYLEFAGDNAQMWIIPEATHCDGPRVRPDEYAARMIAFFDAAFGIVR
jgi:hypothetical protein